MPPSLCQTLGDDLSELGVRIVLVGKTHMQADTDGMRRLGIDPDPAPRVPYDDYLNAQGFSGDNSWEQWTNSAASPDGTLLSGWLLGLVS